MKTDIKRAVNTKGDVFKLITIITDKDELLFEAKLYTDTARFQCKIDEKELLEQIESIPNLIKSN